MAIYPDKVNSIAGKPAHAGRLTHADATATAASFECGSFVRIELAETEGKIELAYRTNGCGFLVAAADVVTEHLTGQSLSALHGLADDELTATVEDHVGQQFPNNRLQCLAVVLDGIHAAFANLRESRLAASSSSEAIICTCFSVSEETIQKCIEIHRPKTIEEVTALSRAGGGCGSCRMLIGEMLDEAHML
jgi:NifU-like protein